jgi:hypothetical protein
VLNRLKLIRLKWQEGAAPPRDEEARGDPAR